MITLEGKTVFHKLWFFLRKYILILKAFDLFLQGTFLTVILLSSNAMLLLRRDAGTGHLSSLLEDWVLMGVSGLEFILGAALAWMGRFYRNFALASCLAATAICGLLVLAFPYLESKAPIVELCNGDPISAYSDSFWTTTDNVGDNLAPYRIALLILTVVMCSLSTISIWSHGLTYLDDHDPQNGAYYYGILISIRLSLGFSGQSWLIPGALRDDWWEAHLSLSMLVLMFAILFTFFPINMPQWKHIDVTDNTGFFASCARLLRNKRLLLQILALSLLNAGLYGFVSLDSAYVQARFHVEAVWKDPRTSRVVSDIFRALVVIFFVLIFRVRFSNRREDGVKANTAARVGGVVTIFVSIFFGVIAGLHCSTEDVAGIETSGQWQQPQCSWECRSVVSCIACLYAPLWNKHALGIGTCLRCNPASYGFTPVCVVDSGVTHFSPCSAGCNGYENLNGLLLFNNCSCGVDYRVVRGSCELPSCQAAFSAYIIIFTVMIAVCAAAMLMQGMVVLRAVQRWDKSIAQGLAFSTVTLLAHVPGHLLYMSISYLTCSYKSEDNAGCIFHKPTLYWAAITSSILSLCSAVVSFVSSRVNCRVSGGITSLGSTDNPSVPVFLSFLFDSDDRKAYTCRGLVGSHGARHGLSDHRNRMKSFRILLQWWALKFFIYGAALWNGMDDKLALETP